MNRRLLLQAIIGLMLFGAWTAIVLDGISHGSRESAWIDRRFGDWPEEVRDVHSTFDIQLSIFVTFASRRCDQRDCVQRPRSCSAVR